MKLYAYSGLVSLVQCPQWLWIGNCIV